MHAFRGAHRGLKMTRKLGKMTQLIAVSAKLNTHENNFIRLRNLTLLI